MAEDDRPTPPPQPYTPPTLVTYGDAVTLTQGRLGRGKVKDGAAKLKMRTR
jgi:hypothetical protein